MALEGQLTSFSAKSETIYTNDHPAVIQPLVMDETVLAKISAGTILKSVAGGEDGAKYAVCEEADTPCAVLLEEFDPADKKTSAMCLLHGTVKTALLKTNGQKPKLAMLDKLQASGIFSV